MFKILVVALIVAVVAAFGPATSKVFQPKVEINNKKVIAGLMAGFVAFAPMAAFAADIDSGSQVFAGNCAACHAGGNNVIENAKTLRKEALEQYLTGGLKEASIVMQVTNGKNSMPAFGGRLETEEIEDVAAYVYDQATGGKWD
jgi:cytochrome c6